MSELDADPEGEWEYHTGPVTLRRSRVPGRRPTSGSWTTRAAPTGCTPTRGGSCASRASSSRASAPSPSWGRRSACSAARIPVDSPHYTLGQ